jgi:hypothetical protein
MEAVRAELRRLGIEPPPPSFGREAKAGSG